MASVQERDRVETAVTTPQTTTPSSGLSLLERIRGLRKIEDTEIDDIVFENGKSDEDQVVTLGSKDMPIRITWESLFPGDGAYFLRAAGANTEEVLAVVSELSEHLGRPRRDVEYIGWAFYWRKTGIDKNPE